MYKNFGRGLKARSFQHGRPEKGVKIEARQLSVGDYVISDNVVIERKTYSDFIDSIRQIGVEVIIAE